MPAMKAGLLAISAKCSATPPRPTGPASRSTGGAASRGGTSRFQGANHSTHHKEDPCSPHPWVLHSAGALTNMDGDRCTASTHTRAGGRCHLSTIGDTRHQPLQHRCQHRPLHTLVDVESALVAQAPDLVGGCIFMAGGAEGNVGCDGDVGCSEGLRDEGNNARDKDVKRDGDAGCDGDTGFSGDVGWAGDIGCNGDVGCNKNATRMWDVMGMWAPAGPTYPIVTNDTILLSQRWRLPRDADTGAIPHCTDSPWWGTGGCGATRGVMAVLPHIPAPYSHTHPPRGCAGHAQHCQDRGDGGSRAAPSPRSPGRGAAQ